MLLLSPSSVFVGKSGTYMIVQGIEQHSPRVHDIVKLQNIFLPWKKEPNSVIIVYLVPGQH